MRITCVSILLVMLFGQVNAKSFGVIGDVFPVVEMSFLTLIEERLAALSLSGELETLNQRWLNTVARHADRPNPLPLSRALTTKRHYYKPEIVVGQAITDINGRVLHPKGTRVNALEKLPSYTPCWLLFNADDEAQVRWAEKAMATCAIPKLILTGGAVSQAEKRLDAIIYFDQAGRITKKLQVSSVPAWVKRQGNQLVITELAIKENGDAF